MTGHYFRRGTGFYLGLGDEKYQSPRSSATMAELELLQRQSRRARGIRGSVSSLSEVCGGDFGADADLVGYMASLSLEGVPFDVVDSVAEEFGKYIARGLMRQRSLLRD